MPTKQSEPKPQHTERCPVYTCHFYCDGLCRIPSPETYKAHLCNRKEEEEELYGEMRRRRARAERDLQRQNILLSRA